MRTFDLSKRPALLDTVDTFLAAVPWTKHRTVIVYLREHGERRYVRLRTFNKHRTKGCWYPAPRFYTVPIDRAEDLGRAIIEASRGRTFGVQPEWWADFEKQYEALPRNGADRNGVESEPGVDPEEHDEKRVDGIQSAGQIRTTTPARSEVA